MLAENKARESQGYAQAYDENAFEEVIKEQGVYHNALITNLNQG